MGIFFTSDAHWHHRNIIEYCNRPFATIEEHDEALIRNWNEKIGAKDTVFVLGDVSLSQRVACEVGPRLAGTKYLISGNHDHTHSIFGKKAEKSKEQYELSGWVVCQEYAKMLFDGQLIAMSHFPSSGSNPKHKKYWPPVEDLWLLHGHVHTRYRVDREKRFINVGVDVNKFYPISLEEVLTLIREAQ